MANIHDVAKLSGLSIGTVSRVFNNSGYVSEKSRKKVEDAIKKLNYAPNANAMNLLNKGSKTVALIMPRIDHPLFSRFAYFVEKELDQKGYKTLLCNSNFEIEKEQQYINMLNQKIIDGIIFISNSEINKMISSDLPIVTIDRHFSNEMVFISSDNYEGGKLAAKHLIEKECKNLAFLGGFPQVQTEVFKRKQGFLDEVREQNRKTVVFEQDGFIEDENVFVKEFVNAHPNVDGVFCITDMLAYKLVNEYRRRGIDVPSQVKIVGYDGLDYFNVAFNKLTTIVQPIDEMGILAADSIIKIINNEEVNKTQIIPIKLEVGSTS